MSDCMEEMEPFASEIRKRLLGRLEQKVPSSGNTPWATLSQEILLLDTELQKSDAWRAQDQQGAVYLKIGCTLLAAYRTLQPLFRNDDDLLDIVRELVTETYIGQNMDAFLEEHFGICSDSPDQAWNRLRENFIAKSNQRFGRSWVFEQGIRDSKRFFVNVKKCGFADFLLDHGARDLLYVLCAGDYAWADGLKKYNIRFERPTALSEGADACRFQFFNDH